MRRYTVTLAAFLGLLAAGCAREAPPADAPARPPEPVAAVVPPKPEPPPPVPAVAPAPREVARTAKPAPPPPGPEALAFAEAEEALRRENYPRAIAKFTEVIAVGHRVVDAYFQRGLAHYARRDYNKATADWTKVIQLQEDSPNALYNRGLARYYSGRHAEAAKDFEAAGRDADLSGAARARRVAALEAADHVRRAVTEVENAEEELGREEKALARGVSSADRVDRAKVRLARARAYLANWSMRADDEAKARGEEIVALERIVARAESEKGRASAADRDAARAALAEARIAAARLAPDADTDAILAEHRVLVELADARLRRAEAAFKKGVGPESDVREAQRGVERERDRLEAAKAARPTERRLDPRRVL